MNTATTSNQGSTTMRTPGTLSLSAENKQKDGDLKDIVYGPRSAIAEHKAFFRQGNKPGTTALTKKLFLVLRGLPGAGAEETARSVMFESMEKNVKTMALLSTEDFFYNDKGEYVFDKDNLNAFHRRNFDRAAQHFILGTELVILNNYNIKKSHYRHYVTCAVSFGYDVIELPVGKLDVTPEELRAYSKATGGRVPEEVIRRYAQQFEP